MEWSCSEPPCELRRVWGESTMQSVDDSEYSIVSDRAAVITAKVRCWRCRARIEVAGLYCESGLIDGEPYEEFTVSNITAIDDALRRQLGRWPTFRFAHSAPAGGRYLVNHCSRCGIQQADHYLHCEPSGAFFRLRDAPAGAIGVTLLTGRVRLTGDEGFEP
jgi:hypothetical protein